MPRRAVKIKKMIPKGSEEDTAVLNDMFAQMTGTENADTDVIIPKIKKLHGGLKKYSQIYKMLLGFKEFVDKFPEYENEFGDINNFVKKVTELVEDTQIDSLEKMDASAVNNIYKQLKDRKEVQTIVVTSGNLSKYKRYLEDKDNLGDEFIKREPGLSL